MDSEAFSKWFVLFEEKTRQFVEGTTNLEPRLLIYDGHLSRMYYPTLDLARKQNVTIINMPAHTTDVLQPLDVSVFKSLKSHWGKALFGRLKLSRSKLSKAEFSKLLVSSDVWNNAFSSSNNMNGFEKCGVLPVSRDRYPIHRFNGNLKNRYDIWLSEGKRELSREELYTMFDSKDHEEDSVAEVAMDDSGNESFNGMSGRFVKIFIPDDDPHNTDTCPIFSETLKDIVLQKLDRLHENKADSSKSTSRINVNLFGAVVTSDADFEKSIRDYEKKRPNSKR